MCVVFLPSRSRRKVFTVCRAIPDLSHVLSVSFSLSTRRRLSIRSERRGIVVVGATEVMTPRHGVQRSCRLDATFFRVSTSFFHTRHTPLSLSLSLLSPSHRLGLSLFAARAPDDTRLFCMTWRICEADLVISCEISYAILTRAQVCLAKRSAHSEDMFLTFAAEMSFPFARLSLSLCLSPSPSLFSCKEIVPNGLFPISNLFKGTRPDERTRGRLEKKRCAQVHAEFFFFQRLRRSWALFLS